MNKRDMRRWAYRQIGQSMSDEPAKPWPLWGRVLFLAVALWFVLRLAGVV